MKKSGFYVLKNAEGATLVFVLILLLLLTLLVNRWILPAVIGLYLLLVGLHGLYFAVKGKDARYLVTIPLVFAVEHISYTAGFWKEIFRPRKMPEAAGKGQG